MGTKNGLFLRSCFLVVTGITLCGSSLLPINRIDVVSPCSLGSVVRDKRNASPDSGSTNLGNPTNSSWICKPEDGAGCTFRMPVLLSVGSYWHKTNIISEAEQRQLIMMAARKWQEVTKDLRFEWAPEGAKGHIEVTFAFIDGPRGAVGRAGVPTPNTVEPTWVRLDDAEQWVTHDHPDTAEGEYSVQWALLHEFGHAIGLRHSSDRNDIMFNELQATRAILSAGDIIAAQRFYGDYSIILRQTTLPPGHFSTPGQVFFTTPSLANQRPIGLALERTREHSGGLIVDSLPPAFGAQIPATSLSPSGEQGSQNVGQNAGVQGLIITDDPTSPPRRSPNRNKNRNRKKRGRKCTKQRQKKNQCKPTNTKNKQKASKTPKPSNRRPTSGPSSVVRELSKSSNLKSGVSISNNKPTTKASSTVRVVKAKPTSRPRSTTAKVAKTTSRLSSLRNTRQNISNIISRMIGRRK